MYQRFALFFDGNANEELIFQCKSLDQRQFK